MDQRWVPELVLLLLHIAHITCAKSCSISELHSCPDGQICIEKTNKCECPRGLVLVGDKCETPDPSPSGQVAITVMAVLIATSLISVGLFLLIRRYNLIDWIRQKIEARRNHDVLYEDVMIGQDDPPLSL